MKKLYISIATLSVVLFMSLALNVPSATPKVSAASSNSFDPGHIIDDAIFYDSNSMTANQVQDFLNSKVPTCDVNGSQPTSYYYNSSTGEVHTYNFSGATWVTTSRGVMGTRYDQFYGISDGAPPYTCLKDYTQNTPAEVAESGICDNIPAYTGQTAAQIITDVSSACGVSPKVLIVLLQKEQGLVTDDWPWKVKYEQATGYGCPDTPEGCQSEYYGFFNQVWHAARQFKRYRADPSSWNFVAGQSNYIQYNPSTACGGTWVTIQNQATAGLYDYTPYQPDAAALAAGYGTGDSCSAYGNRNFYLYYSDWFGNPNLSCSSSEVTMPQVAVLYNPISYDHFYTAYRCEAQIVGFKLGYAYEGAVFNTTMPENPNAVPVFRLYNPKTYQHMWTVDKSEVEVDISSGGYSLEGIAFYVVSPEASGVYPVYRLYNPKTFQHIWTPDANVIKLVESGAGFYLEGIAFYSQ